MAVVGFGTDSGGVSGELPPSDGACGISTFVRLKSDVVKSVPEDGAELLTSDPEEGAELFVPKPNPDDIGAELFDGVSATTVHMQGENK